MLFALPSFGADSHILFREILSRQTLMETFERSPAVGKVLTSVHQSLFTCFIRQGCVKTNSDCTLYWNSFDSLATLLSFCSIKSRDDIKKKKKIACECLLFHTAPRLQTVFELCVHWQMRESVHPCCCMCTLAYLCLYLWVFPEQRRGEQQLAAVLSPRQH